MNVYLMTVEKFKQNSFVDTNVDDKVINMCMLQAQEQLLEPVLGSVLYNKIMTGIKDKTLDISYQNLLVQYVWKPFIYATQFYLIRHLLYRLTNSSVVKDSNNNSTAIESNELEALRSEFEEGFLFHKQKLVDHLYENTSSYPEFAQVFKLEDINSDSGNKAMTFYYEEE